MNLIVMIITIGLSLTASIAGAQQVRPTQGGPVRVPQDLITITSDTPFDQALIHDSAGKRAGHRRSQGTERPDRP